ncbi:hypothetical protein TTHERM_00545780 (macronuclear) [Tetrahymena thermophila SB210]|uniref:Uncharacterized protein n=1 Tax=Tetrahymena thermophila (strain SB210) TaxID=312017 RepID=I7M0A0_TETTS|nr:hypothetical protein TTHERM_00545780 [Tetrahymena thermophila SB210]EAR86040.2 hypothetical protein TTHERM_00545780 [Tetrahymena thermophila SB210]|eukprot:XP_976635.2 hypothetical protein TTHERM_00545780 [Tetrahymena thermophila SB210]
MDEYSATPYNMDYIEDMIAFRVVLANGMNLTDYEKMVGKVYLSYVGDFRYTDSAGNQKNKTFFAQPCVDPSLKGYQCFNTQQLNGVETDNFTFNYDPSKTIQDKLALYVAACIQDLLPQGQFCAVNPIEYAQVLYNVFGYFETRIKLMQFNTKSKKFETKIKTEQYMFDESLAFYSKYTFQKTDLKLIDGFVIQSTVHDSQLSDYTRVDSAISQSYLFKAFKSQIYGGFYFMLGPNNLECSVQYPQFTSLLAQFSSVFNTLLMIGLISRMLAQTEIVQDFVSLHLQVYYKQTAAELLQEQEKNNSQGKKNNYGIYKSIQEQGFKKKFKDYLNISTFQRIKMSMTNSKNKVQDQQQSKQMQMYKQILNESIQSLDIYEMQKELLRVKIMLRMMFSAEQYAALQLCGSRLNLDNLESDNLQQPQSRQESGTTNNQLQQDQVSNSKAQNTKNYILPSTNQQIQNDNQNLAFNITSINQIKQNKNNNSNISNHLEVIDQIERDETQFQRYLDQFIQNNKTPTSEINKRIIQSMINCNNVNQMPIENFDIESQKQLFKE